MDLMTVFALGLITGGLVIDWLEDEPWWFVATAIVGFMLMGRY